MPDSPGIGLLCSTRSLGGIELNVLRFAHWMRERGHRVLVIGRDDAPLLRHAAEQNLPHVSLGSPRKYGDLGAAHRLAAALHAHDCDILQLNVTQDLNLGVLARAVSRNVLHLLHTQHMQFGGKKTDLLHRLQHARLAAWVSPLPWLAEQTKALTTIPPSRIHVIPFGIDLRAFEDMPSKQQAREDLALPQDMPVVGIVGRLDRGKGQEYLLRAAALLHRQHLPVHLLIVGEDTRGEQQDYGRELRLLAAELDIESRVSFRGFTSSVLPAYAAMDCFALTSLSETYGMVTIEAMAAGLPVVGSDTGGTPEILAGGRSGLLVPPRDPEALAGSLRALLNDRAHRRRLGDAARTDAFARFSHIEQCERYEALFGQIRMS